MAIILRPIAPGDLETLRRIVTEPSLEDPFTERRLCWVGRVDGVAAGFVLTAVLPSWAGDWAGARMGVVASHRGRGLGSALLKASHAGLCAMRPECGELCLSAWFPSTESEGFAAHHAYAHARTFWLMESPPGRAAPPEWPAGIEARIFDGSDAALEGWNAAYNLSFSRHYHGVISTVEVCRSMMSRPGSRPDGLMLAFRDGRCVGFCRNELYVARGEIGLLGVVPEARGIGLGRALLRWGGRWLEHAGAPRVTLMVDGENEGALRLYRSEGFQVVRTRKIWSRPLP